MEGGFDDRKKGEIPKADNDDIDPEKDYRGQIREWDKLKGERKSPERRHDENSERPDNG